MNMNSPFLLLLIQLCVLIFISNGQPQTSANQNYSNHHSISAIFVFGDSTVDPGNNNYLRYSTVKSNFPPYGKDFVNHIPTGRFTNGRLVTDFIASYVGVKDYIPPYLDPTLSTEELATGVSFASAGSGLDPLTATISDVISVEKQMEYFREYKTRLEDAIGKERTKMVIKKAVFIVSAGTNDFMVNYFGAPIRRQTYTISTYEQFLMQNIQYLIQDLSNEGARNIVIVGVPPIGCLPAVITFFSQEAFNGRKCIERYSSIARDYNGMLQTKLKDMQNSKTKISYADVYKSFSDILQSPDKFGFDDVNTGCCGTGYIETALMCNQKSTICNDASKFVFWDSIHPTERTYYILFEGLRSTIDFVVKEL
ncbi:hypothetical protein LguiB_004932 [Lonicera macranthoides]